MDAVEILVRRIQRSANETVYVNTLNVVDRVTIDFVWYPGAQNVNDSLIDTFVTDHPSTGAQRNITYTWTPQGGTPVTRPLIDGRVIVPLAQGRRGVLLAFSTEWQVTRAAAGVTMQPVSQLQGVQERLNRLGYHLREPGAQASGVDNVAGAKTEHAVLSFQADYRPVGAGPANRLQVRGEWTQNTDPSYVANLGNYVAGSANPSNADGLALQQALVAYVGA